MDRTVVSGFPNRGSSSGYDVTATWTTLLFTGLSDGMADLIPPGSRAGMARAAWLTVTRRGSPHLAFYLLDIQHSV